MNAALNLAERGMRVFPLVRKAPAFEGWKDAATTDPARIRQWWSDAQDLLIGFTKDGREVVARPDFNIGVACGAGLLVADADVKKGKHGLEFARGVGVDFSGFAVRTPSGGMHEYFQAPDVTNTAGPEATREGLDIRSAGGFVVGPGSVVDGLPYILDAANDPRPVPPALMQLCIGALERRNADPPAVTPDRPDTVDRALDYIARAPTAVEGAAGDLTTFKVAATLKDYGISEDMAVDLLAEHWNDRCSPPWALDDLKLKVRNAYEYGARPVGDLHPMADFKGVAPIPAPHDDPNSRRWFHDGDTQPKVDWLYYNMMPKVGVGVLLAESGAGKTFLSIHLAHSLGMGAPFFGETPDDRGATLFLYAGTEGSGFPLRLAALKADQRLPIAATVIGNLSERDALPKLLGDLRAEARWLLAEFGLPVRLIVLETLAASALLTDENDNAEAGRAMANLATISREMGAFVLTSHHPDKAGRGARGASAIPNAADYNLEIGRDGNIRELTLVKARDAEDGRKLGTFTLLPVELGKDDRGRPIVSMAISTGEAMSNATRAAPHAEKLIEALEWAIMESGEDIGGRVGCEESLVREVFKDRKGGSRDRSNVLKTFKAAKSWLQQIGRLDVVPVGTEVFLVPRTVEVGP